MREVIWVNICWFMYHKRYPKVWKKDGLTQTPLSRGDVGRKRNTDFQSNNSLLYPAPGALGDTLGPTKGIPGLPVDPWRIPGPLTYTYTPMGQACPRYLCLSLERANPEPRASLCRDHDESKAVPSQNNPLLPP